MNLTPEQAAAITQQSVAALPSGEWAAHAVSLARVIADELATRGLRIVEHETYSTVLDVSGDEPRRIPLDELRPLVGDLALAALDAAADLVDDARARARATATARAIRDHADGGYLRRLTAHARDLLPEATDDDLDALAEAARARRAAKRTALGRTTANAYAAASRSRDRDDARAVLSKWLPTLTSGRHLLGDVWDSWRAAVSHSGRVREAFPGALRVGRTTFYELLDELGEIVSGGARRRYLVIPEPTRATPEEPTMTQPTPDAATPATRDRIAALYLDAIRERLAAGDKLGALLLQRDRRELEASDEPLDLDAAHAAIAARTHERTSR
ncbi:hypothetical protein [Agromyces sp. H66]|uniref:hypothetical protein n=1 Tax=Agromyces sp. H66 TaxID=2529859 RepID=UPI0010AA3BA5|nr:hypothetical protein [Agromyces sp. H66]